MIGIASDHGGYNLKNAIVEFLKKEGYIFNDFGTFNVEPVDYPDYAIKLAKAVSNGECEKGILICGTGIGVSIVANKIPGIRAALCLNPLMAKLSREHTDSNIIALGERLIEVETAIDIVETWLKTDFSGGRHSKRLEKISMFEKQLYFNK